VVAAATIGAVAAGAALLEAALLPGIVIGGAALLAPGVVDKVRRGSRRLIGAAVRRAVVPAASASGRPSVAGFPIARTLAKTVTYRIVVTSLDFTWNYAILGDIGLSAGLSAISLAVGPVFYLVHETAWQAFGAPIRREPGRWGPAVAIPLPLGRGADPQTAERPRFTVSRAVAKTITFRTIATTMDFTVNYAVVGEFGTALALSAFGIVVGPFVYLGHEMAWDRYGEQAFGPPAEALSP
jgi:uncharacterized membrane protein